MISSVMWESKEIYQVHCDNDKVKCLCGSFQINFKTLPIEIVPAQLTDFPRPDYSPFFTRGRKPTQGRYLMPESPSW